jgi:hypothetical protein
MSKINVDTVEPEGATTDLTLGAGGDKVVIPGTIKISGGSPGADKLLTSDADGDATWEAAAGAGGLAGVQVYTATSNTWTKADRETALGITITKVMVEVQGAGGSGSATLNYGGGAGGGYAKKFLDVSNTTTATATIGTGGAAISANAGAGITGGLSSFVELAGTGGWVDVVGNGGGGKPDSSAQAPGGTGTGGDINFQGSRPSAAFNMGVDWEAIVSTVGKGYGSGGGYGYTSYGSGAGVNGIVVVWEYQ